MLDPGPKLAENTVYFDPNYTISRERASYKPQGDENEKHDSGVRTPPLWRTSPTASPPRRYRSLSPASKAQAIARGQKELMDMVRTMPEGCFELSLRDLVEKPWARPADHQHHHLHHHLQQHHLIPKEETATMKRSDNSSSSSSCRISRNGSMDSNRGGFLLKMVFPVSVGSKKKKQSKKNNPPATSGHVKSRVSPKPSSDKDWWKRKIPALEESTTATTTTRSGHEISLLPSCCSFIRPRKIKEQQ